MLKPQTHMSGILPLLAIMFVAILAYSNTLDAPFQFDDLYHVTGNPLVIEPYKLLIPAKASEENIALDMRTQMRTRALAYASFAANRAMGGDDPRGYHIANLLIHLANTALLYLIALWLLGPSGSRTATWVALASAALFALHPIQTQAVTYISQRFASMATMFYLCTVALYIRHRSTGRAAWLALSLISAMAAMHTKEIAFTLPVMVALVELIFFSCGLRCRLLRLAPFIALMAVIPAYMLIGSSGLDAATRTPTYIDRWTYFVTSIRALVTYLRMIVLPTGQNIDHDYALSHSLLDGGVLLSGLLLFALLAWALMRLRNASIAEGDPHVRSGLERLAAFGVLWFFVTISVENSVIAIEDVLFEHRMYLPSAGLFMSAGALAGIYFIRLCSIDRKKAAVSAAALAITLALALSFATYSRNEVWRDPLRLWADAAGKSPGKARPLMNYAVELNKAGRSQEAITIMRRAVQIRPSSWQAHYNLGSALMGAGLKPDALAEFEASVRLGGNSPDLFNNMGIMQAALGMKQQAALSLKRSIDIDPNQPAAAFNLGRLYLQLDERDKAVLYIQQAMRLDDGAALPHFTMGLVHLRDGDMDAAAVSLEEALKRDPGHIQSHRVLAEIYERKGLSDKAALHRQAAQQ